jgi:hypothetical protein
MSKDKYFESCPYFSSLAEFNIDTGIGKAATPKCPVKEERVH